MLYIIHGEDIAASRNKLLELIEGHENIVRVDGKKQDLIAVFEALESNNLFSSKKTIVIEFFTKIKPQAKLLELIQSFEKDPDLSIVLWEESLVDQKNLGKFKSAKNFSFVFPKVFYSFLDGLSPKSGKSTKILLDQLLITASAEQLVYSIIKRLRQLMMLKTGKHEEFEEFKKMADWQVGKLKKQANLWTEEELKKAFLKYAEVDEKIKTGGLAMPLAKHLDILLLSEL